MSRQVGHIDRLQHGRRRSGTGPQHAAHQQMLLLTRLQLTYAPAHRLVSPTVVYNGSKLLKGRSLLYSVAFILCIRSRYYVTGEVYSYAYEKKLDRSTSLLCLSTSIFTVCFGLTYVF